MHIQRDLLALAIAGALAGLADRAAAQPAEDQAELERIQVTGTRIKKAEIEGQAPVAVITREELEKTGITSVGDILQRLTYSGLGAQHPLQLEWELRVPP
ncbi:MAG: hypothetical protein RML12_00490 [Xanthomonadales bacterium]|nr:hypothetical protein [Xanthomonadales bacterium]